jgi:hypothetical protein
MHRTSSMVVLVNFYIITYNLHTIHTLGTMQFIKPSIHSLVTNKAKLLIVISIVAVAVLSIPVILPHLNHPSMIYHIVLHIASLIVAIFLTVISEVAYRRSGSPRILFMFFGFLALTIVELIYLFDATWDIGEVALPFVHIELPHIILLVMLTLFGVGVIKVND